MTYDLQTTFNAIYYNQLALQLYFQNKNPRIFTKQDLDYPKTNTLI